MFEDTIIPGYLSPIEEAMTNAICPEGLRIRFDRDSIPALLPSRITSIKELVSVNFLTVNEKRELVGFEKIDENILSADGGLQQ